MGQNISSMNEMISEKSNKNELISVIVPIYNVVDYLDRCINSIINQTYTNIEIIVVDDGSTDGSFEKINKFKEVDERVIVIKKENGGVSSARNEGLKIASGEYIGFVDADDYIHPLMFEKLMNAMINNDVELSCCLAESFSIRPNAEYNCDKQDDIDLLSTEEFVDKLFVWPKNITQSVWNKLYKKELIKTNFNENIHMGEDALFLVGYCQNISKIAVINENLYYVFERENSAMRDNPDNLAGGIPVREKLIDMVKTISKNCFYYAQADFLDACLYYLHLENIKKIFVNYIKNNKHRIILNPVIRLKLKCKYLMEYINN